MKQKHKVWAGIAERNEADFIFTYSLAPGSSADIRSLNSGCGLAFLIKGTGSLNMHGLKFPGWFSSLSLNVVD